MKTTTSIKPSNTDRPKYPLCWWCNDELEIPEYTVVNTRGWDVTVHIECADEMVLEGEVVPSPSDDEPAAIVDRDQPGARSRQPGDGACEKTVRSLAGRTVLRSAVFAPSRCKRTARHQVGRPV